MWSQGRIQSLQSTSAWLERQLETRCTSLICSVFEGISMRAALYLSRKSDFIRGKFNIMPAYLVGLENSLSGNRTSFLYSVPDTVLSVDRNGTESQLTCRNQSLKYYVPISLIRAECGYWVCAINAAAPLWDLETSLPRRSTGICMSFGELTASGNGMECPSSTTPRL